MVGPMPRLRLLALSLLAAAAVTIPGAAVLGGRSGDPQGRGPRPGVEGDAAEGQAVFLARCASCHGESGQGTARGPSLIGVGAAAADFELRTGRMPFGGARGTQAVRKPPAFDDGTIRDLVAYVASLGPDPAIPDPRVDTSKSSR